MELKFLHFLREDGLRTNSIITYAGYLSAPYEMEDVELKLTVNDLGDVDIEIENQHYYSDDELKEIESQIKLIDWENGYEFIDFVNLLGVDLEPVYKLIGNRPSKKYVENYNNLKNGL
jgi:hypothetical protein